MENVCLLCVYHPSRDPGVGLTILYPGEKAEGVRPTGNRG